jgi:hypothetical protein
MSLSTHVYKNAVVANIDPATGAQCVRYDSSEADVEWLTGMQRCHGVKVGDRGTLEYRRVSGYSALWFFVPAK